MQARRILARLTIPARASLDATESCTRCKGLVQLGTATTLARLPRSIAARKKLARLAQLASVAAAAAAMSTAGLGRGERLVATRRVRRRAVAALDLRLRVPVLEDGVPHVEKCTGASSLTRYFAQKSQDHGDAGGARPRGHGRPGRGLGEA